MDDLFRDLTVSAEEARREEEDLRLAVRELPDDLRKTYHARVSPRLRDPDTYAVLNWLFVGVHHVYLGRWWRGLLNVALVAIALALIFATDSDAAAAVGIALFAAVAVVELLQLFRSQTIVADHNNRQAREVLRELQR